MRISDWSSDVGSSDLHVPEIAVHLYMRDRDRREEGHAAEVHDQRQPAEDVAEHHRERQRAEDITAAFAERTAHHQLQDETQCESERTAERRVRQLRKLAMLEARPRSEEHTSELQS